LVKTLIQCVNINKLLSNVRPPSVHNHFDMVSAVSVYAKLRLSQVNVRQNVYATGRKFEFICHNDPTECENT